MTTPWQMARVASRRELTKPRKIMGPVGERDPNLAYGRIGFDVPGGSYTSSGGQLEMGVCRECGYHVCSCEPVAPRKPSCMYCGAEQEDLGPLKTRMICVSCADARKPKHPNGCPCTGCIATVVVNGQQMTVGELNQKIGTPQPIPSPDDHETHVRLHNELRAMIAAGRWTP